MDPTYVDFRKTETGGDPRFWYVNRVTPAAREEVGQWPAPAKLIDRLAAAFSDAASREPDPVRRDQLRHAGALLGGPVRDVAVQVAANVMARPARAGHGQRDQGAGGGPEWCASGAGQPAERGVHGQTFVIHKGC
jgi:hypothetical protein